MLLNSAANSVGAGGTFSMAYDANSLTSMAMVKERIMLSGGVLTPLAMSASDFKQFEEYSASSSSTFTTSEALSADRASDVTMWHAVFCYGWWDNPRKTNDGYWLCKNR
jgi:hypothetical protein